MLYGNETWLAKEDVIRLQMNDARMFIWMWNVRYTEDRIYVEKLSNTLELNNIMGMLIVLKTTIVSLSRISGRECLV